MSEPSAVLQALRASSADLLKGLAAEQWSDADVARASLCEGWTRGHVLSHLARNADGIADTLSGALRGEIVARYPGGWDARCAAIDAGATRGIAELSADLDESIQRLDRVFGAADEAGAWDRPTEGGEPAAVWPANRWREVEIHRIDLAGDYTPDRWPPQFVATFLGEALDGLPARTEQALRVRVAAEGSLGPEHAGTERRVGDGDPIEVAGPDWAVLAWLIGRPSVVGPALTATPPLAPWR